MKERSFMTRRDFLCKSGLTLGMWGFPLLYSIPDGHAQTGGEFLVGVNYPWTAYGHDFGKNAWGHDGLITNGWTYQTSPESRGFTDTRRGSGKSHTGVASLRILADLAGDPANPHTNPKQKAEVYVDLRNHRPLGTAAPVNLEGVTARCWLWLPKGSAGSAHAPNGVQLFFKSQDKNSGDENRTWWSWYSRWENIQPAWEENWVEFTANLSDPPGFKNTQFDPRKVIAVGVKVAINDLSNATLNGAIYFDDYVLETDPPISFNFEKREVDKDFLTLQRVLGQCQTRVVRVFVFADGRAAPDFTTSGKIRGFDKDFFRDFDILLQAAQRRGLLMMPVLLDFHWCNKPEFNNGVQLGGHSDIIRNLTKRQTFFDRALKPFLERYNDNPSIYAIDLYNEPEWVMKGIPNSSSIGAPVSISAMQEFVRLAAELVHTYTPYKVTVGSARRMWLHYWKELGLDVYQFHWYDKFIDEEPFPWQPYAELGLDKPCIIGEVPTKNTQFSPTQYLEAAQQGGYHGLLVWSYRAGDKVSDFPRAKPELEQWCAAH